MIDVNFIPFPLLETERFSLRPLYMEDDKDLFTLRSDKSVNQYIGRTPPQSIEEVREFINKILDNIQKGYSILWAVCPKGSDRLSGTICLWNIVPDEAKAEIGYELLPEHWGKGIMQEVIPVVLQFGFEKMRLETIDAVLDEQNVKSVRLTEKFGFVKVGPCVDEPGLTVYRLENGH